MNHKLANRNRILARRAQAGDRAARDEMVELNRGLVFRYVNALTRKGTFVNSFVQRDDAVQVGMLGLMRAVEKYDPDRAEAFSTYATFWIRQFVQREFQNNEKTIRLPVQAAQAETTIERVRDRLAHELGREPTTEEFAEIAGESVGFIEGVLSAPRTIPIDKKVGDGRNQEALVELVQDENVNIEAEAVDADLRDRLLRRVNALPDRLPEIVTQLFGLDGQGERSAGEVGRQFNVSRERIRQLKNEALELLRQDPEIACLAEASASEDDPTTKVLEQIATHRRQIQRHESKIAELEATLVGG